jgi:hypothetical protein
MEVTMTIRMNVGKIFLPLASVTLIATSALHALGYAPISKLLAESSLPGAWAGGVRGLWVEFSMHLIVLAALLLVAAARPLPAMRVVVLVCGLALAVDTVVLGVFVGIFVGTVALGAASLLTLASWVTHRAPGGG